MKFKIKILDVVLVTLFIFIMYFWIVLKHSITTSPIFKILIIMYSLVWLLFFYYPHRRKNRFRK